MGALDRGLALGPDRWVTHPSFELDFDWAGLSWNVEYHVAHTDLGIALALRRVCNANVCVTLQLRLGLLALFTDSRRERLSTRP